MKYFGETTKQVFYSVLKIFFIISLAIVLPKFFTTYDKASHIDKNVKHPLLLGSDVFVSDFGLLKLIKDVPFAIVCDNPRDKNSLHKKLSEQKLYPKHLFCVENGDKEALPVITVDKQIYVEPDFFGSGKSQLNGLRTIIFDVQGMGVKFDLSTRLLRNVMSESIENGIRLIVLDNPNPLGGRVEGPGKIPLRHGLTNGELARYINETEFGGSVILSVVSMRGWSRSFPIDSLYRGGRDVIQNAAAFNFLAPFLKIKQFSAVTHYKTKDSMEYMPFLVFSSSQFLSEWEWGYLSDLLEGNGISCSRVGISDSQVGLKIDFVNISDEFDTFGVFLKVMKFFSNRNRFDITFDNAFDDAVGTGSVRDALQNKIPFSLLIAELESSNNRFCSEIQEYLMYSPRPYAVSMASIKVSRAG